MTSSPGSTLPRAAGADQVRSDVIHLLRRTGYTARPEDVDAAVAAGYDATVQRIVTGLTAPTPRADAVPVPPLIADQAAGGGPTPTQQMQLQQRAARDTGQLILWWMGRMVATEQPFQEKVAFFWHGHFATAIQKVKSSLYMFGQNALFRRLGLGPFLQLTMAVSKDPAMLIWLDADQDRKGHPNENFARELMELFTLGIGNYTEADVKEGARCFTGWGLDRRTGTFVARPNQHDDGTKTFLGTTGNLTGDDAVRLCCQHPATARHLAARVWSRFAAPITPDDPIAADLARAWSTDQRGDTLLRAVLLHPQFRSPAVKHGLVKQPVEWIVGTLRALRLSLSNQNLSLSAAATAQALGQVPFNPPSVGGWSEGTAWLSTAAQLTRLRFAQLATQTGDVTAVTSAAPADRPAAAARILGVEAWSAQTTAALRQLQATPKALVALALISPEFVLA